MEDFETCHLCGLMSTHRAQCPYSQPSPVRHANKWTDDHGRQHVTAARPVTK